MPEPKVAPYGSWRSPLTSELVASHAAEMVAPGMGIGEVVLDGEDVYWMEAHPEEEGRCVVVRYRGDGEKEVVTPAPFNVRTRVHEYGGGAYTVSDGTVFFSNFVDQRFHHHIPGAQPRPLTPEGPLRYADGVIDRGRGRTICVREDHSKPQGQPENTLVGVDLAGTKGQEVLVSGNDFYAAPRLSPDRSRLAWITWVHPNMPFDAAELWVGSLEADGSIGERRLVAGGADESACVPEWSPDGVLYFVSDRSGSWSLWRWQDGRVESACEIDGDMAPLLWLLGASPYGFESTTHVVLSYMRDGLWHLASLDTETRALEPIEVPYSDIWSVRAGPGKAVFTAGSPTEAPCIVQVDFPAASLKVLHRSGDAGVEPTYLSLPQPVEFPTEQGLTAHAFFYTPNNPQYVGPPDERPPLLVIGHGGPTMNTWTTLRWDIQYWTSRGIAVLDVNYGGSTGYGRAYRRRLLGKWGVVDVDDVVNGALYLVRKGMVDPERLGIRGESAGGYLTLAAVTFRDCFKSGASYYGISDLEILTKETHKLESHYIDSLVGPYPERRDLYRERSPIQHLDQLSCAIIFFQGLEDMAVPPNQAELMVEALRAKGLPVAHVTFDNEGHGFRRLENIRRCLDAELYFHSRVFGFDLPDPVEPVTIDNL